MNNYSHLIIPYSEFENTINNAITKGEELRNAKNEEDKTEEFEIEVKRWVENTKNDLEGSFAEPQNPFTVDFIRNVHYRKKTNETYYEIYKGYKEEIRRKLYQLKNIVNTISVCENIKDFNNSTTKENLTTIEKASLLLEKLYELQTDNNHTVKVLLEGNGVLLNSDYEAIELAQYLEERGLISISHHAGHGDLYVSITTEGKILYEEQTKNNKSSNNSATTTISNMESMFIVHGHNNEIKETVARFVEKIGFNAIILHEMPNKGMTVIEKFTTHSNNTQYAIVILSADDFAYPKNSNYEKAKLRPRQNVVFELGYFIGKLGRERVFVLYETLENFEIHSDFSGVVLVPFDSTGTWKMELGKELNSIGVNIDWNMIMK